MNFDMINEEVLYTTDEITKINAKDINMLKSKASNNPRKRMRLCAHNNTEDTLHEMLILLARGAYFRPHKHINKSESFHIIEGNLSVVIFGESGDVQEVIKMGSFSSGDMFYYRISESYFHTVIPESDLVVFHETTNGPFQRDDTSYAVWAPVEEDSEGQKRFLEDLNKRLNRV